MIRKKYKQVFELKNIKCKFSAFKAELMIGRAFQVVLMKILRFN